MPKYAITCVESLAEPGLQMVSYKVEANSAEEAMEKFGNGESEVFMESKPTDAAVIGIELIEQ